MSFHRYALRGCDPSITLDNLLDEPGPINYQWVSDLSVLTKASNTLNVWGEGGSASCSGVSGISDVFGSGLWAIDQMFEMAFRGISLACLSGSPQALYGPFRSKMGILDVRPTFYGMLMFNIAIGGQDAIVYRAGLQSLRLKTWAAYDSVMNVHTIVVVHKSTNVAVPYSLTIPGGTIGQLIIMTAPLLTSVSGFSIAGLTFDGTTTGMPSGTYTEQIITAVNNVFTFTAQPGSATLLKVYLNNKNTTLEPLINFNLINWANGGTSIGANGALGQTVGNLPNPAPVINPDLFKPRSRSGGFAVRMMTGASILLSVLLMAV